MNILIHKFFPEFRLPLFGIHAMMLRDVRIAELGTDGLVCHWAPIHCFAAVAALERISYESLWETADA